MNHAVLGRVVRTASVLIAVSSVVLGTAVANAEPAAATPGRFVADQVRILDTRNGTGGYSTPMAANVARTLTVAGAGGVPTSDVTAVEVTVTVVGAPTAGDIAVAPGDATTLTNGTALVYNKGDTDSNTAVVALNSTGKMKFLSDQSGVNLILDLQGYFSTTAGSGYVPVAATRVLDTRTGIGTPAGKLSNGSTLTVAPGSRIALPPSATAVYASVVIVNQAGTGNVTAYPTGTPIPSPYSLNFDTAAPQALGTTIPLNSDGQFDLRLASGGPTDVIVDIEGYFDSNASTAAFTPAQSRRYDSRVSPNTALAAEGSRTVTIGGTGNIPAQAGVVAINLIAMNTTGTTAGFLTAWTAGQPEPAPSSLNFGTTNTLRSSLILVTPDSSGRISIHNHSTGPVHIVIDAEGWSSPVP
jgi:hypothetical protein